MELALMAKLATLIKDRSLPSFLTIWGPLLDFLLEKGKNEILGLGFDH